MPAPLLLAASLIVTLLASADARAQCCWTFTTTTDGSTPTARHEAGGVLFDGELYLLGGRGPRPVDRFDPTAETWTDLGPPPLQMHHFQPVVHDGKIWVLCAFQGVFPNEPTVPNIWTYDPGTNTWTIGPSIPVARRRGSAGVVVYDDMIYVVGGNTQGHQGGFVPWFDRYDPATDTWTALPDAPHARDHFTAVVVGNKLVAAGGRQTDLPNAQDKMIAGVDVYDFSTGAWSTAPEPIPTLRAGTMAVARDEHVVVIGGESPQRAHEEVEALDLGTGEWTALPDLLDSRHGGGAVLVDGVIYVASGSGNKGGTPELTTTEELDVSALLTPSPSNLLANADFDAGLAGWVDAGDLSLAPVGSIAAPALDVEAGDATQTVPGDGRETYTLSGVHASSGPTGDATVALEFLDALDQVVGSESVALANAADFTSFALTATSPAAATQLRVRLAATGDRVLRVDDLVLVDTRAETPRLGVPANAWALLPSTGGPVGGTLFDPRIDHTTFLPDATFDLLGVGFGAANAPISAGTLLIDPGGAFFLNGSPGLPFLLPIPTNNSLVGFQFTIQGASIAPSETLATNAIDVVIQDD